MDKLISDIETFCRDHKLSEWQFGELALNDRKFIGQLRDGRDLRLSTLGRVHAFMAEYTAKAA